MCDPRIVVRYLLAIICCSGLLVASRSGDGLLSPGALAHAQGKRVERHLSEGQAAFQDQDYEKAVRLLGRVVDEESATSAQRGRALELIGLSKFILGERDEAAEWFLQLVVLDPSYELTDDFGSEELRAFFYKIKDEFLQENAPVKLIGAPPESARAGQKLAFEVRADAGAEEVKAAVFFWRASGEDTFHEVAMAPMGDNTWRGRMSAPAARAPYTVEYFMESRDIGGRPNGRLGGPGDPMTLDIQAGGGNPWYRRWYVIAGGVVVVGITTAMLVAATR